MQVDFRHGLEGFIQVDRFAFSHAFHGTLEHLVIKVVPHGFDFARLVFTQHFTCTANFQVVHGEVEAATQIFQVLDGFQALFRVVGHRVLARRQHVRIGLVVASAHATAQLVQLRKTELVGAVDQNGVGGRHVNPGLDDRGAQKDVEALLIEITHHGFQLTLAHLTVCNHDAGFGNQRRQLFAAVFNARHVVVQEVNLTATLEFTQNGFTNEVVCFFADKRLNGEAALRCRGDHGELANAFQTHRQGTRNRRGCER